MPIWSPDVKNRVGTPPDRVVNSRMELGVVEIIVIVELRIAPDGVKSVMFRAIRDSAQAVPGAQ